MSTVDDEPGRKKGLETTAPLETTQDGPPAPATPALVVVLPSTHGGRFVPLRHHARGGLGDVFVARDEELGREVALKTLQVRHADEPRTRARFVREAEITGHLEHPGIVPVYGLGRSPEGRPYYAMQFIQGEGLDRAVIKFHAADGPDRDPGERALGRLHLLGCFLATCNAVDFAHSRGIVHRDLKPSNVMLGRHGETLVVDWGLAKRVLVGEEWTSGLTPPPAPSAVIDSDLTLPGSTVGTPAFMSPEQAAGRLEDLGPASDVYNLGATLYCILTGRPPFLEEHAAEIFRSSSGRFPPPQRRREGQGPAGAGSDLPEGDGPGARGPLCLGACPGRGHQALDRARAGLGLRRAARRTSGPLVATASDLGRGRDSGLARVARDPNPGHGAGLAPGNRNRPSGSSPSGCRRTSSWTRCWP